MAGIFTWCVCVCVISSYHAQLLLLMLPLACCCCHPQALFLLLLTWAGVYPPRSRSWNDAGDTAAVEVREQQQQSKMDFINQRLAASSIQPLPTAAGAGAGAAAAEGGGSSSWGNADGDGEGLNLDPDADLEVMPSEMLMHHHGAGAWNLVPVALRCSHMPDVCDLFILYYYTPYMSGVPYYSIYAGRGFQNSVCCTKQTPKVNDVPPQPRVPNRHPR